MADTEPSTEFDPTPPGKPGEDHDSFLFTTLKAADRKHIVELTDIRNSELGAAFLNISTLELSALGANAEIAGHWDALINNTSSWHDLGQGGRNVHGLISARGYLFPLGHRAVITTYFDRVFAVDPINSANKNDATDFPVAYLQTHTVLKVVEPVKTYGPGTVGEPFTTPGIPGAADWPFAQVRMVTHKTPDLDIAPNLRYLLDPSTYPSSYQQAIWPTTDFGQDVLWHFVATDLHNHDVSFTMPLVFVYGGDLGTQLNNNKTTAGKPAGDAYPENEFYVSNPGKQNYTDELVKAYLATPPARYQKLANGKVSVTKDGVNYCATGGAPLLFAPEAGPAGGTTHPVLSILLGAATSTADANAPGVAVTTPGVGALRIAMQPNFYPTIARAKIRLHAAEVLTGQNMDIAVGATDPLPLAGGVPFEYFPPYVTGDMATFGVTPAVGAPANPNQGGVWASAPGAPPLTLPANQVGGIGTPNTMIGGLSAIAGTVGGDITKYASMAPLSDLSSYFPSSLLPTLLGGLSLPDILDPDAFNMPTISSQSLPDPSSLLGGIGADDVTTGTDPTTGAHTVTYTFNTALAAFPPSLTVFSPSDGAMLTMTAVVSASPNGSLPTYTVNGSIDPFVINLVGEGSPLNILVLTFDGLTFSSGSGQSTSVNVNLTDTSFVGCLEFVQTLETFLQSLGLGGLTVDVSPTQVTIGTSISIPDQELGVFDISGISFSVGVTIPFLSGKAIATFGFASSDDPFTLVFALFGGGGFVSLGVGFGGLQTLQAQFEVEFEAGIGIEVASGSISLAVGIYFTYTETAGPDLSGLVKINGQVEVLGILTLSLVMSLTLTWEIDSGAVQGTATMRVGVSICGIGTSVPITLSKSFGGASAPPQAGAMATRELVVETPPPGSGSPPFTLPPAPIKNPPRATFSDLIASQDWTSYCGAFSSNVEVLP